MNYKLKSADAAAEREKGVLMTAVRRLLPLMKEEGRAVAIALVAILFSSGATLLAPVLIARTVDRYITTKDFHGVLVYSGILLV
ncbi:MAG: ABC transporter ATP-binding protein, partial [Minisyncoccia bacterium]